jgi:hypothetical protein
VGGPDLIASRSLWRAGYREAKISISYCEPLPQRQARSLYSQGRHDPSMVGRPQRAGSIVGIIGIEQ